jgi:DNA polymerase III subunit epsilon
MLNKAWHDLTLVAFDTETTGKYPLTAEICEVAAVKWRGGEVVETFSTLLKPAKAMEAANIAIHGITNEMVAEAPHISTKIKDLHAFFQDSILIAHHAPFDLGFVAVEFERAGLRLPSLPVICSSLLSRKLIPESPDHRLQTLIGHFNLEKGVAHRALDDAKACLQVAIKCLERIEKKELSHALASQGGPLSWDRFSMKELEQKDTAGPIVQASREGGEVEFTYDGGSKRGERRRIRPVGVVRSLDGDFFVGIEEGEAQGKRFFMDKVTSARRIV